MKKPRERKKVQARQAERLKARRPPAAERLLVLAKEIPRGETRATVLRLRNTKWRVRKEAAFRLGQLGDSRAVKALSLALKSDQSLMVRRNIVFALKMIASKEAIQALGRALKDKEQIDNVKRQVKISLESMVEYGEDNDLRRAASHALRK